MDTPEKQYKDGFERRKEQSKDNIRRAALALFSQFGVDKVSIVDIAKKAGVSQATIYNNFESKEALAREFVTTMVDQLVGNAEKALSPSMPFEEKITALLGFISGAMTDGYAPDSAHASLPNSIVLQADPEIQEILETAKKRMTVLLLDVVHEGKEQGFVDANISDETYLIYFTAFADIFINPKIQSRLFANPTLVKELTALMINGLM